MQEGRRDFDFVRKILVDSVGDINNSTYPSLSMRFNI